MSNCVDIFLQISCFFVYVKIFHKFLSNRFIFPVQNIRLFFAYATIILDLFILTFAVPVLCFGIKQLLLMWKLSSCYCENQNGHLNYMATSPVFYYLHGDLVPSGLSSLRNWVNHLLPKPLLLSLCQKFWT